MAIKKIWLLPFIAFVFVPGSFFITYGIALSYKHVDSFLPFISDTGTLAPESCIFGQLLNIGALMIGLCAYLRHRQIVEFYGTGCQRGGIWWRRFSLGLMWIGFTSAFGISMVANFQKTRVIWVHRIGALMAFCLGIVYGWGQTMYSYLMKPRMVSNYISHIRLLLCFLATVFFCAMLGFRGLSKNYQNESDNSTTFNLTTVAPVPLCAQKSLHWDPNRPGYKEHLVATTCEWLMSICFMLFVLSFAIELRHAELIPPKLLITGHPMTRKIQSDKTPLYLQGPNVQDSNLFGNQPNGVAGTSLSQSIYPAQ